MRDEIIGYLGDSWTGMLELINSSLYSDVRLLHETNGNLLGSAGKLLRPMISLLIAKATGTPCMDSLRFAAACELLHNATLMHDDVADKSPERRGRPSLAAVLGPSAAVLIGDFWLAKTVELIMKAERHEKAILTFCRTMTDLSEGEMLQMEKAAEADTTEADYLRIIHDKTASLFETAGETAALSTDACAEYSRAARDFSSDFGMAFQIKDDILDYVGTESLGKPVGIDIREKKITLPVFGAMRNSGREEEIRAKIRDVDGHPAYCDEIRDFVIANGGIEYAARRLDGYIERARGSLQALPDSAAKEYLMEIAGFNAFERI